MDEERISDNSIVKFLNTLGLSTDQAKLYLVLVKHGVLSKLELSRKSKIKRTNVYRYVEIMKREGVIEELVDEHRKLVQAVPPDQLERLLKQKQDQVNQVAKLFPQVEHYLQQQINRRQPDTKVLFYRGQRGIQQMAYNILTRLKTEGVIVGYTFLPWVTAVGEKFAEYFYEEMRFKKLIMREIFSDAYIESLGGISALTQPESGRFSNLFESRYIAKKILDINHQSDIYNNVVTFYNWREDEVFGVEIYNKNVAKMQRQIFEILWKQAIPEKELIKKHLNKKSKSKK